MTKKTLPVKKKSRSFMSEILDGAGWVVRQAALPVPDGLIESLRKKKKGKKK